MKKLSLEDFLAEAGAQPQTVAEYHYFNCLNKRELLLDDAVDGEILRNVIVPLKHMMEDGTNEKITIYIQSPGGSVWDSLYLVDVIEKATCPIDIIICGYAMSMGILIAMAGKDNPNVTRKCYDKSIGLLHSGSISISTDQKKAKEIMNFNNRIEEKVKHYVLSHTSLSEELYNKHVDDEWYMLADDMLEHGIVDEII